MATENIGALVARVVADNNQFRAQMLEMARQVESNTARMNRGLERVNSGLGRFGKAARQARSFAASFGVALSVGALILFSQRTVQAARELDSLSKRLGGSTEALSELQFVAEQSDVQFNVLSLGLQRMTRRIAEAAEGSGEAIGALKELGLSATLLARLALDEQFEVIADRLANVGNESHRVRLAMKLFDSEGVALLQTMTRGAAGIREMREEARELGVTLSKDNAEAAARAARETEKFRSATGALARDLTLKLIPALTDSVEWWRRFLFPAGSESLRRELEGAQAEVSRLGSQIRREFPRGDEGGRSSRFQQLNADLQAANVRVVELFNQIQALEHPETEGEDNLGRLGLPNLEQLHRANELLKEMGLRVLEAGVTPEGGIPTPLSDTAQAHEQVKQAEEELTEFIRQQHRARAQSAARAAADEAQAVLESQSAQLEFRSQVANAISQLAFTLFGRHKAIQLAAIAFEKLMAVRRIKIAVEHAAWQAFQSQLIPGDPTSLVRAWAAYKATKAKGAVSVARTIALSVLGGLAEAAQVLESDGSPGSFTNPLSVTGAASAAQSASGGGASSRHRRNTLQVIFQGPVYGWDEYIRSRVIDGIRQAVNDKDVVLIEADSRQGSILGAPA